MECRKILVVGATGAQGSATINALSTLTQSNHATIEILALTRSTASPKAQSLATRNIAGLSLIEGDLTDPAKIFHAHPDIDTVFLVTVPPNDEAHGVALINAAISNNVQHIVFSSVDRGGETTSWENPSTVPHFAAKHRVELHLRTATAGTQTTWTILRPTGFMDNYLPSNFGSMMAGLWATMPADKKMQLVGVDDIGRVAAMVLLDPQRWVGRAIGLVGDELTFSEANAVYKRVYGHDMPVLWGPLSRAVRWAVADARQSMEWFEKEGFKADVDVLRRDGLILQDFETWLTRNKVEAD